MISVVGEVGVAVRLLITQSRYSISDAKKLILPQVKTDKQAADRHVSVVVLRPPDGADVSSKV